MDRRDLYHFTGLIFAHTHKHAHYTLHNRAYFTGPQKPRNLDPSKISHYKVLFDSPPDFIRWWVVIGSGIALSNHNVGIVLQLQNTKLIKHQITTEKRDYEN
jgi:hypothetical protein